MSTKIKQKKRPKPDNLDMRINQLIARYSNICDSIDEPVVDSKANSKHCCSNGSKRNAANAIRKVTRHKTSRVYACPLKNDHYFYMYSDLSDSDEEKVDSNIRITCHKLNDDNDTDSNDTDSSLSTISNISSKESPIQSKHVKFLDHVKHVDIQTSFTNGNSCKKSYAEKTTYCRPIVNHSYDRQVIQVMERNAKLRLLLTKYVIDRQKEKLKKTWNNYVNMMKMKNQCLRDSSNHFLSLSVSGKSVYPLLINDFYDRKYNLHQSDSCKETLHDLYDAENEVFPEYPPEYEIISHYNKGPVRRVNDNKQHCSSSTSKLRKKYEKPDYSDSTRPYHETTCKPKIVIEDKNISVNAKVPKTNQHFKHISSACSYQVSIFDIKKSKDVQTNITFGGYNNEIYLTNKLQPELQTIDNEFNAVIKDMNDVENIATTEQDYDAAVETVSTLKDRSDISKPSIKNLEDKLDTLINLFNSLVLEMKTNKALDKHKSNDTIVISETDGNRHTTEIYTPESAKTKKRVSIVGNVMTNTSLCALESHLTPSHYLLNMRLEKILHEELSKSNKIRSEIENMLKTTNRSCTVEVNDDIPTKERSTEVTDSLSKTKLDSRTESIIVEQIGSRKLRSRPPDRRIAVNTEPLGLLSLLRMSTEAVKQILSFIPDVSWYLTRFSRPVPGADYVCNICGAAFTRPSELGAHILSHDLGQTRDCSICRRTVDSRRPSQLSRCRHCGQRFTRAYCCELHQRGCRGSGSSVTLLS